MKIDDSHRDHIQAVMEWLEKNVRVYPTPSRISIRQIRLDSNTLRGEALLFVGDALPGEALTLRMGDAGWLTFTPPLFHSPLGAPATYGAIELTDNTTQAVSVAIRGLLPRLLPFGINPKTQEWVTASTPLRERIINAAELNAALERITHPNFEWVQSVAPDGHLSTNEPINETRT